MIIWLNGTFGVGKTTTAGLLCEKLVGSRVFDPETVGIMLRPNLLDRPVADFQHWPPWRPLVVATAIELIRHTGDHLIAVQTILHREYLEEIIGGLRTAGHQVLQVLLDADDSVLRDRIVPGESGSVQWRLDHLADYSAARTWLHRDADLVVDTAHRTADQVAAVIAERAQEVRTRADEVGDRVREPGTRVGGVRDRAGGLGDWVGGGL